MSEPLLVYVTCKNVAEAKDIAAAALAARVAACANILPGMISLYAWKGENVCAEEAVLLLKTFVAQYEACAALIKARHSYEVPCILALPIMDGSQDFLQWMAAQIKHAPENNTGL